MTYALGGNLPGGPVPYGSFLELSEIILKNYPQYTESYVNVTEKAIWQNSVSYNKNHPFLTAESSKLICQNNIKNVSKESGVRCLLTAVSLQETEPVFQLSICWGGLVLWVEVSGTLFTETMEGRSIHAHQHFILT